MTSERQPAYCIYPHTPKIDELYELLNPQKTTGETYGREIPIQPSISEKLSKFATILQPNIERPVFSKEILSAVDQWFVEIDSESELKEYNLKVRRTVLLSGPPGCGKTMLVNYIGTKLNLPVLLVSMSTIVDKYIGQGARNVHELFSESKKNKSCILFLDEFDSIATKRTADSGSARERDSVVISLLQEIDTFPGLLFAATNLSKNIDPAIHRRFSINMEISLPDEKARKYILSRYISPLKFNNKTLNILADATEGAPAFLLQQLMEGIKRDIILSPKYNLETDYKSVFTRVLSLIRPHEDSEIPPLWAALHSIKNISWPPTKEEKI